MTRRPRETYVPAARNGFPERPSVAVQRRRVVAISLAAIAAAAIAIGVSMSFFNAAGQLPGVDRADAVPVDDGETGEISLTEPISPFDDAHVAVARLDPALREAVQSAASDAAADGVELLLTSGWRSADYQAMLLRDAVDEYGSESAAREFVSTPEGSRHVSGEAVDIARVDPALWLEQYGSAYGLCRVYANESWHFELATTPGTECPPMLADASEAG
ncbi:M15 family metallopeptidase [Leucobacter komagatae]|uniref:M15 family metallopeptidase n=1 Tax=Leucobacter komagatae TaxID=55969 RepID=UPI000A52FDEF|nr:M15 family metallopeptidase [Leucobacter komagatae]